VIRVALAIDGPAVDIADWHTRALRAAFAEAGAESVPLRLAGCGFDTAAPHGLVLPGFDAALPDAVFVRAIAAGSFEEVTRRLGVLHALRECRVPVWNDARAIERCVDKSMTSFLLARAGLPTPPTWAVEGADAARAVAARELPAGPLVCKPLFGSQGRGLRLVAQLDDLPPPEAVQGVYYLQRFVPPAAERSLHLAARPASSCSAKAEHPRLCGGTKDVDGRPPPTMTVAPRPDLGVPPEGAGYADQRLFVAAGRVLAAMTRRHRSWITNLRQGAAPERLEPDATLVRLALAATEAVGADYAGVDLLRGADGAVQVIEVNSMPGWRGLQTMTDTPIARRLAEALLARLR
jgi:glutathione synthase/RimK-type ligase-like ATP-grasp enzyme